MKIRFKPYFIAIVSIIILAMPSVSASSQDKPVSIKLGVVNLDDVTRLSLMSKDIARQIDARRKKFRDEIKKEEESLRKSADNLQKQRVILAPEAFRKEERKFRQKTADLQRKVQQRNQEFIRLKAFATRKYEQERAQALLAVAKKNNFTLVLRRREVLVSADFLDITKLVLETLNARKQSFKLPDDISKIEN
ncbi:MAG: hypothetical protein CMM45_10130 [Rhodospirillaceae bacterium]|nr:hypothetical protein [Rhodospirillaceae bacterium]